MAELKSSFDDEGALTEDGEFSDAAREVMKQQDLDEGDFSILHGQLYACVKEFGTEATEAVYKLAAADVYNDL